MAFAASHNPCVVLDSCEIKPQSDDKKYKLLLAFGGNNLLEPKSNALETLFKFWNEKPAWMFGVLSYNLKNEIENLHSHNHKCFNWPTLSFFIPETIVEVKWNNKVVIHSANPDSTWKQLNSDSENDPDTTKFNSAFLTEDLDRKEHSMLIQKIHDEIRNGNVYELNLCTRFLYHNFMCGDPFYLYRKLRKTSPSPFSAYYSAGNKFIMSSSPERYLFKNDKRLVSQPIKGTRPRKRDNSKDVLMKEELRNDPKDRAENVMIVDLVRNDLSRVSIPGSVKVEELFGIYTFEHLHHMISTISSKLKPGNSWMDAIKNSFPMGSMTGAPKISAMQYIEQFEKSDREWYSGALGYIDPEGNFDFNVLIRTIFYDEASKNLAYYAGGAITIDSVAEKEYEEILVKSKGMQKTISEF